MMSLPTGSSSSRNLTREVLRAALICSAGLITALSLGQCHAYAAGGTSIIASKGQVAHVADTLPDGIEAIINDPCRTTGWNSWFTEWPNDVNHYAMQIESAGDLDRLIKKLVMVDAELVQIRLCHLKEPQSLGWVTSLPEGNGIPVVLSIGNQARIDQWYGRVRKPFGVMEFTAAPVAVPPTLTLFVQNKLVDLDKLQPLPEKIRVEAGNAPTLFHKSNTKREQQREKASKDPVRADMQELKKHLSPAEFAAYEKIDAFLAKRQSTD